MTTIKTDIHQQVEVGFSLVQLREAFDRVRNSVDWKSPINAVVKTDDLPITILAIEFYTATKPTVLPTASRDKFKVLADGYRKGPAA